MFREVQRFQQWWIWLLVYGIALIAWYGLIQQVILGEPFGTNPAPDWAMWLIWLLCGVGIPVIFHAMKLIVEVREDHICIRYVPFVTRRIYFREIERYEARTYRAIVEYGGWGIKGWSGKKMAYNVSGNQGVELELRDGRHVMIGSQRPQEMVQAISEHI
jgi:hypothetical protein